MTQELLYRVVTQNLFYRSCFISVVTQELWLYYPHCPTPSPLTWCEWPLPSSARAKVRYHPLTRCDWTSPSSARGRVRYHPTPPHPTLTKSWGRVECERAKRFPKEGIDESVFWSDARVETMSRSVFWSDAKCVCSEVMSGMVFWSDPVTFWGYRILRNPHMLKVPISIFPGWLYFSKWMN